MALCELSGVGPTVKNLVSHSNIKTKSIALPNIQKKSLFSRTLGTSVKLKISTATLKSIEHCGGLDKFILSQPDTKLSKRAKTLRQRIRKVLKGKSKSKAVPATTTPTKAKGKTK